MRGPGEGEDREGRGGSAARTPRPERLPRSHLLSPPVLLLHAEGLSQLRVFFVPDGETSDGADDASRGTWEAAGHPFQDALPFSAPAHGP